MQNNSLNRIWILGFVIMFDVYWAIYLFNIGTYRAHATESVIWL